MSAYYNENDPAKAEWLRKLIRKDVIAPGRVDERSIEDVRPDDVAGHEQCHWFAGIGIWSYALRLAGWPDEEAVWTGSCPCPSFSAAGKGTGFGDARHLWPAWARLIRERKPPVIFGEQADDAIGYGWLDLVQTDLEAASYAIGKAVLGACSVGASDIRQRLYFMAHTNGTERKTCHSVGGTGATVGEGRWGIARHGSAGELAQSMHSERGTILLDGSDGCDGQDSRWAEAHSESGTCGEVRELANTDRGRREQREPNERRISIAGPDGELGELGEPIGAGLEGFGGNGHNGDQSGWFRAGTARPAAAPGESDSEWSSPLQGFWRDADWLLCRDGRWRPVEPGTQPLVNGAPARLLRLRGYGDALNAYVAKAFIEAAKEVLAM